MWAHQDIDGLDNRDERVVETFVRFVETAAVRYFRSEVRGIERIPRGAGLYVGNHNGGMITPDSFLFGAALYRARGLEDLPYGLGHDVPLSLPIVGPIVTRLGAVRASHDNASRLFARGAKVLVYPGGDLEAMRPYRHRNKIVFGGRRGYVRLALREDVPIIPVVAAGAHSTLVIIDDLRWLARLLRVDRTFRMNVWPIALSVPWGLTVHPFLFYFPLPARILVEVIEPIRFESAGAEAAADEAYVAACAQHVESVMQATLSRLAAERE